MNIFIKNHQQALQSLITAHVDFIIIGGYSVIFHGYMRTTGDMDIWLKPDNENKQKFVNAMVDFGLDEAAISQIKNVDFTVALAFNIDAEPERIDFLTKVNLVDYGDADKSKVYANIEGMKVPFLHLNHLVLSKMNTGRAKDVADIEELQRINKLKENK
jgi:predicted nucleotidyltransferase